MTNTIQKKFKVSSTQLLYQSCPYQSLTLFLVGPFLDGFLTNQNVFAFNYTSQVVVSFETSLADIFQQCPVIF
jgi:solute carrier family 35 protein E3